MDKEDFYTSLLKHKDVILGAPWFDRVHTHIKFLERKFLLTCRGKDYALTCNSVGSTILVVALSNLDKVIKNFVSCYMVFVKEHEKILSELKESKGREFQGIFTAISLLICLAQEAWMIIV